MANLATVAGWVEALDHILVDKKRKTWSAEARVTFLTLAVDALKEARPDAFTEEVAITLKPGTVQTLPEGAMGIVGRATTLCLSDKGEVISAGSADEVDSNTIAAFAAFPSCPAPVSATKPAAQKAPDGTTVTAKCSEWGIKGIEFSPSSPGYFNVTPPVPAGSAPVIKVKTQMCAPSYSWPDDADKAVQCRHKAALLEMILYYAYQTPQESELALQRAAANAQRFERLLGFQYRMQSRFNSEYFLGRKPDGQGDEATPR